MMSRHVTEAGNASSKGQVQIVLSFLLGIIIFIVIFGSAGCVVSKFMRISDQGQQSSDRLYSAITVEGEALKNGETTTLQVTFCGFTAGLGLQLTVSEVTGGVPAGLIVMFVVKFGPRVDVTVTG